MPGVNNWRVGLPWPAQITAEDFEEIEHLYEDDAGITQSSFSEEMALSAMLLAHAVFLNSNWWATEWPEDAKKTVSINVNTNDIFAWGCADAETITHKEIEEVYRYWVKGGCGTAVWAIIRNREMPQRPVEKAIREAGVWDLDALTSEHGLRANRYDGISGVLAGRKRVVYLRWCEETGRPPLSFDGGWWDGWKEYTEAHPNWYDDAWKAADNAACNEWRVANGYELQ